MTANDALFAIMFGPLVVWWLWEDRKFRKTMDRWAREDAEIRERIRQRQGGGQ